MNIESFFKISYGLYVVSSFDNKKLNGFISNTVFQVSANPAKLAIACSKNNFTAQLINASGLIGVSVLAQNTCPEIIGNFGYKSGKDTDKFASVNYTARPSGVPILTDDTLAWFECKVEQTIDVGTHLIFISLITESEMLGNTAEPLTYAYYREVKKGKAPKNAPTFVDPAKLAAAVSTASSKLYICNACGYVYDPAKGDPEHGIAAGTPFEQLPADWHCPSCGADKEDFSAQLNP
jgi:flavin reductase (DIM6/NTAB) family NADH-FMN oxidoreductase RutF/rubredoxin